MIHTLSYSASTATRTDRFMVAHMHITRTHTHTQARLLHRCIDKQGTFLHTQRKYTHTYTLAHKHTTEENTPLQGVYSTKVHRQTKYIPALTFYLYTFENSAFLNIKDNLILDLVFCSLDILIRITLVWTSSLLKCKNMSTLLERSKRGKEAQAVNLVKFLSK